MHNPRTRITLKKATPEDEVLWVTESASVVRGTVNMALDEHPEKMVTFSRVRGLGLFEFSTQACNVLNVEDVSE